MIKDLKLGGSQVLKGGSKSKPIRLEDGDHEIPWKVDGIAVGLKPCFVKKAWNSSFYESGRAPPLIGGRT